MEKVISALSEIKNINTSYEISTDDIDKMQHEIDEAKVCIPIIGKFSSGKSALVNTLLGYSKKILKEDITPETAIPAEIVYSDSDEKVTIIDNNNANCANLSVSEYRNYEADANIVKSARIQLRNDFLKEIPDVMIVDMPGFESGFEIHNKAIDNYLPQSLAYIVTFPADDMIVRSSVGNILKELCLHDMPLCVVITKYDKKNDDFEDTFTNMKESLKRFVGDREITFCMTSSFTGDAEELESFLKEIQEKSQDILADKYRNLVLGIVENTENYLITTLNSSNLSESELNEQEEKLHRQLSSLSSKFSRQQDDFDLEISECVEEIKNDVQCAMEAEESNLVAMAMNNQSINDYLNNLIRNAVTMSVKKRFIPRVEKYIKRVSKTINSEAIGDIHVMVNFDTVNLNKGMTSSIVAVVAGIILGLPVLGILAGIFMKIRGDKKREEAKQRIRMKLQSEVFPQALRDVGKGIEMAVNEQIALVNKSIEEELKTQKETLQKAIDDVRNKINDEKAKKENLAVDIKNDLEAIARIKLSLSTNQ